MGLKQILSRIRRADIDFNLIQDGDVIAVGVSGGKDSMLLLYALSIYQRIALKFDNKNFKVIGIHLEMGFPDMDFSDVNAFCLKHEIEYHDIPTRIYDILKLQANDDGTIKCSLCSKLKKGAVIQEALKLGCNKTAFAHHADDAIETLFLNMIYGGRIATFAPSMLLTKTNMEFIRPFVYCYENDIRKSAIELDLPVVKSTCPRDGFTKRQDIKDFLHQIYHTYPSAHGNFLTMLSNNEQLSLWVHGNDPKPEDEQ